MRKSLMVWLCLTALAVPAQQTAPPAAPAETSRSEPLLRINVNLVQVDAVVTDSKGRHVSDLRPEDFEIRQDGKVRAITNFSYIPDNQLPAAPAPAARRPVPLNAMAPPPKLNAEDVRRTIALVVDDLALSFEGVFAVQRALKDFIDRQMQPGDLVVVIRTSAGMGALQQFTSDKRMLSAAISQVKFSFRNRVGITSFAPVVDDRGAKEMMTSIPSGAGDQEDRERTGTNRSAELSAQQQGRANEFERDYFTAGTLGALQYVIQGMRKLPGRKSVVLFSENLSIRQHDNEPVAFVERLRRLADQANRSAVVLYAVDPRGPAVVGFTAQDEVHDDPRNDDPRKLLETRDRRRTQHFDSQTGLSYLADQTGGLMLTSNDPASDLQKVLEDQSGFYLLGYHPEEGTFGDLAQSKYHRVQVKVLRPGLRVRSRSGFLGISDETLAAAPMHRMAQLQAALASPFLSSQIPARLSCWFDVHPRLGPAVYSMVHIDAKQLQFTDGADGKHFASVELLSSWLGADGVATSLTHGNFTIQATEEQFQRVMRDGVVQTFVLPATRPGAFQFRVVVRDTNTNTIGSASQFMEVPEVQRGRLALSGILMGSGDEVLRKLAGQTSEGSPVESGLDGHPAIRKFRIGEKVAYGYKVINAKRDRSSHQPQLESSLRLFRNGQLVFSTQPKPLVTQGAAESAPLRVGGVLQLTNQFAPGDYALQILVTDRLAKDRRNLASQWADFELATIY